MFSTRLNPTKPPAGHRAILERLGAACRDLRAGEEACYLQGRANEHQAETFGRHGMLGLGIDEAHGGLGGDALLVVLAAERLGREGGGPALFFTRHTALGGGTISRWGSPEQKERWLPRAARGELLLGFALAEAHAGANLAELASTFEASDSGFVLNGRKAWVFNGDVLHAVVTFARDKDSGRISAFLVERSLAGYRAAPIEHTVGLPTISVCDVWFEQCRLPRENLIGPLGGGLEVAATVLQAGRLCTAATSVGVMADCLEEAAEFVKLRTHYGQPLAAYQLVQRHITQMAVQLEAARALVYAAAGLQAELNANPSSRHLQMEAGTLVSQAKYYAANAAYDTAQRATQLLGGEGYLLTSRPARHLCDTRAALIYDGTNEILEQQIAAYYLEGDA
jgi:alkylation response protein AidB-like acyl-CoA dehydrogenase